MRRTPYDIAFGPEAEPRFAELRASLARTGRDPHDADAFVLDPEVVRYLRELVPEEGVGEAVAEHVALLHHAYLYWDAGGWLLGLSREGAQGLLTTGLALPPGDTAAPATYYAQFPARLVWAALAPGEPHQPLDGLFVRPWPGGGLFALAVFGLHPGQEGFSVVAVDGYPPTVSAREDGTARFAPLLEGGAAAGLHSIADEAELLELAARTVPLAAESRACAGASHRPHQAVELGSLA